MTLTSALLGAFLAGLLINWAIFYGYWPNSRPAWRLVFSEEKEGLPYLIEQEKRVVVSITTQKKGQPIGTRRHGLSSHKEAASQGFFGSGVILNPEGYILTNYHVIDQTKQIRVQELNRALIQALELEGDEGVLVSFVELGGPGQQAGLHRGDVIMAYEGQPIQGVRDFQDRVALTPEGKQVELSAVRQGDLKTLTATVVRREVPGPGGAVELEDNRFGLTLRNLYLEKPGLPGEDPKGLLVVAIEEDGRAIQSGLQPGDILLEINGRSIFRIEEYRKALDQAGREPLLFFLQRGPDQLYLAMQ